jgi:hydrogenase maturation protease
MAVETGDLSGLAAPREKRTLLLGLGNPILSDDAVGIRLAGHLKERLQNIPGLDLVEDCSLGGFNLLEIIEGYGRLIVLDSIRTAGADPGAWHYFTAERLRETMNLNCVHDVNFATALELGRRLGMALPPDHEIHIFAVEILENLTFSERMSAELESRFPAIAEKILAQLEILLRTDDSPGP